MDQPHAGGSFETHLTFSIWNCHYFCCWRVSANSLGFEHGLELTQSFGTHPFGARDSSDKITA